MDNNYLKVITQASEYSDIILSKFLSDDLDEEMLDDYYSLIKKRKRKVFGDNLFIEPNSAIELAMDDQDNLELKLSLENMLEKINVATFAFNIYMGSETETCINSFFRSVTPFVDDYENEDLKFYTNLRVTLCIEKIKKSNNPNQICHKVVNEMFPVEDEAIKKALYLLPGRTGNDDVCVVIKHYNEQLIGYTGQEIVGQNTFSLDEIRDMLKSFVASRYGQLQATQANNQTAANDNSMLVTPEIVDQEEIKEEQVDEIIELDLDKEENKNKKGKSSIMSLQPNSRKLTAREAGFGEDSQSTANAYIILDSDDEDSKIDQAQTPVEQDVENVVEQQVQNSPLSSPKKRTNVSPLESSSKKQRLIKNNDPEEDDDEYKESDELSDSSESSRASLQTKNIKPRRVLPNAHNQTTNGIQDNVPSTSTTNGSNQNNIPSTTSNNNQNSTPIASSSSSSSGSSSNNQPRATSNNQNNATAEEEEPSNKFYIDNQGKLIKVPKTRGPKVPWTDEEVQYLEDMLSYWKGTYWSAIVKEAGSLLGNRSQIQVKDKARNELNRRKKLGLPLGGYKYAEPKQ